MACTHSKAPSASNKTPKAALRGDLKAARSTEADFQAARQAKTTATTAQTVADSNGKAWLGVARRTLVNSFGNAWSQAWTDAGFPDNSTAVPDTIEKRQELLASLGAWLKTHPDHEVPAANVQFTAARSGELFKALSGARSGAKTAVTNTGSTKAIRDAAVEKLRRRMRGLIDELDLLLADDDPKWHQFGLNPPAARNAPTRRTSRSSLPALPVNCTPTGPTPAALNLTPSKSRSKEWMPIGVMPRPSRTAMPRCAI